ncbi:uncharacterized protein LOC100907697 [Galendromus occidentalis]|uniref:Uncharacterized protein LOC100907697 n=1 Tax=Galendromus occidentalis TaxID=34638 RepID=A0AAJ6VVR6_9ACAR|nr:uncharacterized protein LOC100907697 [Galendromus occidentalis]
MHLSDPKLMMVSYFAYTGKLICKSLMFFGKFMFWIQLALGSLLAIGTTAASSHLTRLLAPSETAVVFGLSSSFERVVPLFVDIGFSAIYAETIATFPGLVFIFEASIFVLPVIFAGFSAYWLRSEGFPDYATLSEGEDPQSPQRRRRNQSLSE